MSPLLLLLLAGPSLANSQHFISQPRNVTAVRGDTVTLRCAVSDQDRFYNQQLWLRDEAVITRGPQILSPGDRERCAVGSTAGTTGNYNLVISDVRPGDAGVYRCVFSAGPTGLISDAAVVRVNFAPVSEQPLCSYDGLGSNDNKVDSSLEVAVGETLSLSCDVEGGEPRTGLVMMKGDAEVRSEPSETGIRYQWTVTEADQSAEFSCSGTHRFWAEPRTCRLGPFLVVRGSPTVSLVPSTIAVDANASVSFLCSSESAPRPEYKWFIGGDELYGRGLNTAVQRIDSSSVLLFNDVGNEVRSMEILCMVKAATGTAGAQSWMTVRPVYDINDRASTSRATRVAPGSAEDIDHSASVTLPSTVPGRPARIDFTDLNIPYIACGTAAGCLLVLVVIVVVTRCAGTNRSTAKVVLSTEQLDTAEGALGDDADSNYYFRSRGVGVVRSWLFPVHQDTQKAMSVSAISSNHMSPELES